MVLCDSHLHLQDPLLDGWRAAAVGELRRLGVAHWGVNGTRPGDWAAVEALSRECHEVCPSYGLHPWFTAEAEPGWEEELRAFLERDPKAAVGEIGIDKWVREPSLEVQLPVFQTQLRLANELDRPVTIHCLSAWGPLWRLFQEQPELVPRRGFLLHSYGGPAEMIAGFCGWRARFSFSGYFLEPRKEHVREIFRHIPEDRLLIETDAPAMLLPNDLDAYGLESGERRVNHPGNIAIVLQGLAEVLGKKAPQLAALTLENHRRLFGER